ncbi:MAG: ATP synthase F1 subunit gamma [Armatimonadota bacterium]|nr:ATP synthase F1 subunit gamma [Armatimonadota bacterium]MCX7776558.1 ATP synthase F1 subunit gamma [Armatimonadota bacterium]MDW8026108.1 ATP synthase F1 subunit gamma [Armatimonadota bacterium]
MQSLRVLRRKIRAVRNIRQITQAMKMVAAARLKRVQNRVLLGAPYASGLCKIVEAIIPYISQAEHPLLKANESSTIGLVVVTGDKGLCGAYNANVIKEALELSDEFRRAGMVVSLHCVGHKGATYFAKRDGNLRAATPQISVKQPYEDAKRISRDLLDWYLSGEVRELHFVYTGLISTATFKVMRRKLLPIEAGGKVDQGAVEYIFEPPVDKLLDALLPRYFEVQVYQTLLEALACEQLARVQAMTAASDNATEMLDRLTLELNKVRQWSITKELIEITTAAEALRRYQR